MLVTGEEVTEILVPTMEMIRRMREGSIVDLAALPKFQAPNLDRTEPQAQGVRTPMGPADEHTGLEFARGILSWSFGRGRVLVTRSSWQTPGRL